ncbi:uncharacterized protein LOC116007665 isoform X2 [Ipomoea triloba]|uniref:uncharacterized protein LOC116007665 isoform X2 n=1 Tax=Ipomoea triloba TaxID=35885 RepID=UPI00125E42C5|nr:uncharacterized protein LOC116007665 isoform X2 [Ipomoea triloba]
MAEHGGNHTANATVELEVMREDDFSWHPCQVSISPNGNGLVIKYGDDCLEDLIEDKEVALARLRIRSSPLQGSDCSLVKEGDHVLATKKSQLKSLFFDAEVEKAQRIRHSARTYCRCTFRVKWLHKDLGDEVLVLPSCAIMKLTTESINVHPTVCAFFKSFDSSNCFTKLPFPTIYGSTESRMETHEFPEARIGKIRSSDFFEKKISGDTLVGVDFKGQTQSGEFATYKVCKTHIQIPSVTDNLRYSEHRNQLHKDNKAEASPDVFMLVKDESVESRSPLNPLAARAALASLVSITRHFCLADDLTTRNGISSKSEAASATLVPSSSEETHRVSDAPFNFTCSPTERKVRLTRSASKRGNEVSHKSLAVTSHDEVKVEPSTKRRLTRLALKNNQEVESVEADTATQGNMSAKQIECDFVQEGKKTVGSSMNKGIVPLPTEEDKCVFYELKMNKENIHMKKTSTEEINVKNISSTRRLTRSAARGETGPNSGISLEQSKLYDHSQSNSDSTVTKVQSPPAAEENKINQTYATSKKTEADECNAKQNKGLKRKLIASTAQQLRSSPRLNSTLQTRSQMKL